MKKKEKVLTAQIRVPRGGEMTVRGTRENLLGLRIGLWKAGNKWVEIKLPDEQYPVNMRPGRVYSPSRHIGI